MKYSTKLELFIAFLIVLDFLIIGIFIPESSSLKTLFFDLFIAGLTIIVALFVYLRQQDGIVKRNISRQKQYLRNLLHEIKDNEHIANSYYVAFKNLRRYAPRLEQIDNPFKFFCDLNDDESKIIKAKIINLTSTTKNVSTLILDAVLKDVDFSNKRFRSILEKLTSLKEVCEVYKFNISCSFFTSNTDPLRFVDSILRSKSLIYQHSLQFKERLEIVKQEINKLIN